ncbi:MEDS domain-containing protein [Geomonas sp.]|uniref:MEDS domain-containing protein n=1 Tax=Geomonas sp. TaxID=2651584 RepID=UPI002B49AEEE|nr:MEDS domain-containing protein [Geomonas sp.]HJV36653.1 MEDS domain-containing protein [Geomonas sp.]
MLDREPVQLPGLAEVGRHDHLCLLHEGEEALPAALTLFVQKGLSLGERCVYLSPGDEMRERVLKNAASGDSQETEALKLLPLRDGWLQGGSFQPLRVMGVLQSAVVQSAEDGYKSTRVICDLGWMVNDPDARELLLDLETALSEFAGKHEATVLCLYDRRIFSAELLLKVARLHPHLVINGKLCRNPLFIAAGSDPGPNRATAELEQFLGSAYASTLAGAEIDKLRQEVEQAYAALARKIYENWQEEDLLRENKLELQQKEEALLGHRRRVRTILQHLPAMLMAFDTGLSLSSCNHEFERVTGFKAEEVMGKSMLDLFQVPGGLEEELLALHPEQGGEYRGKVWEIRCKDGCTKSTSWSNCSRYVQIPGWGNWIVGLDLSMQLHAERDLKALTDQLEARTGELDAFSQAVSHDLSGQLSSISGHCATMQELYGRALSPQCRELLRSILESTSEMAGRINALQRLTTLASAGLQPEEVDLSAMASEIAAQLKGNCQRPVTFQIEDGLTATGDARLLRLAMEQLLENAWNYTVGVQHPVIRFGIAEVEGARSFYVSDNGPRLVTIAGLPPAAEKPGHLCCGIGLATVQRIITLHRGRIWAADQADKGGTLYFTV